MDIQEILTQIELANFKDQVVDRLVDDIHGINLESVDETIQGLKEKRGSLKSEDSNQALELLIKRLESQ
ncbi:MAG: hypothetical protein ACR2MS_11385 [Weeksellaceae bacterium]